MGWLKKVWGGGGEDRVDGEAQAFDQAWALERRRFGVVTGVGDLKIELKDPRTGVPMAPHVGLGQTYQAWRGGTSYSRRKILYDHLAEMLGRVMKPWQSANYLTIVRRPDEALELLETKAALDDTADVAEATARAYMGLTEYAAALEAAERATAGRPDARTRTLLADALHLTGRCDEAHALYDELISTAGARSQGGSPVDGMFSDLLSLETGRAPSPVLALDVGTNLRNEAQRARFWELGELEFYWSPYFCQQHAYELAQRGETDRYLAKLLGIVDEMPWVKEASLNALAMLDQLDPTASSVMPDLHRRIRRTVAERGWTTEGMAVRSIESS